MWFDHEYPDISDRPQRRQCPDGAAVSPTGCLAARKQALAKAETRPGQVRRALCFQCPWLELEESEISARFRRLPQSSIVNRKS